MTQKMPLNESFKRWQDLSTLVLFQLTLVGFYSVVTFFIAAHPGSLFLAKVIFAALSGTVGTIFSILLLFERRDLHESYRLSRVERVLAFLIGVIASVSCVTLTWWFMS